MEITLKDINKYVEQLKEFYGILDSLYFKLHQDGSCSIRRNNDDDTIVADFDTLVDLEKAYTEWKFGN